MTVASKLVARWAKLPPARSHAVSVERDLRTPMPDSAVLLADRWYPTTGDRPPVVILRSPYGRHQLGLVGRLLAERGYCAFIQSTRGSFGSAGGWEPFRNEQTDGHATHAWVAEQPWFGGTSATYGPSYLGLTQWAVAGDPPEHLRAMALSITASSFRDAATYPGGSFSLETGATWIDLIESQERALPRIAWAHARAERRLRRVYTTLPLSRADSVSVGRSLSFYQDWLVHEQPGDPWWDPVDFGGDLSRVPPASLVGGWYDVFLPAQIADFVALRAAGRHARLTVGPWTHTSLAGTGAQLRDGIEWFDEHLLGRRPARPHPGVRLFVQGSERWVDLDTWPPPATTERWHLHAGGRLERSEPAASAPDRFRYDPADPTPGVGGPSLNWRTSGPRNQARREQRPDVVSYTSDALTGDVTIAGPLNAEIWFRSSAPSTDVFVRLCDVDDDGVSINISDGIVRTHPDDGERADDDGTIRVRVAMWPTATTFAAGHRFRLQVSSGAHPLFARNPGSDERLGSATTVIVADQAVLHDPDHPSAIELPVSRV
ncbi:MAG: CocE/NonD family hydrolase [Actinomycetota bacterium]|nr:CocE/NonD family hydrolase [Actinomycetota bacterium]